MERNTIWVLTYTAKNNRAVFLGSYPSHGEAVEAGREEFSRKRTDVVGYDPALLLGLAMGETYPKRRRTLPTRRGQAQLDRQYQRP
jgi:hypothetical protein